MHANLPSGQRNENPRKRANNNPAKTKKETRMNPLTQFKQISIPPSLLTSALITLIALIIVPALLGEGTQHREGLRM